jgi:crotonobetainyl-CoA:carnitine CoA-transferase CaiB-like acyl-CoA transferase
MGNLLRLGAVQFRPRKDPRFLSNSLRVTYGDELLAAIDAVLCGMTTDAVTVSLDTAGIADAEQRDIQVCRNTRSWPLEIDGAAEIGGGR